MAASQVLAFHEASERTYNLTGLRTGSVRDQMLRAILLTEALLGESKEIGGGRDDGLLVIGAGIAGVACALLAARNNVRVTLLEKEKKALTTLQLAQSRRIDPFEYDWPQPQPATPGSFPNHQRLVLNYAGGTASQVAYNLRFAFEEWIRLSNRGPGRPGYLDFIPSFDACRFSYTPVDTPDGRRIAVSGSWDPSSSTKEDRIFGAVVVCAGFNKERTHDEDGKFGFVGPGFWTDNDELEQPNFGMRYAPSGTHPRILISGGGDGAMQDLQRAATGDFGAKLLERVERTLTGFSMSEVKLGCALADDRAKRAWAWKPNVGAAKEIPYHMVDWHSAYDAIVDKFFTDAAEHLKLTDPLMLLPILANGVLKDKFRDDPKAEIVWVVDTPHPGFAYAMNRFLSLLTVRLLEFVRPGRDVLRISDSIENITSLVSHPHICGSGAACHGVPHAVKLKRRATAENFDVVILRHGLIPNLLQCQPVGPAIPEQMAPYELPS